MLSGDHWGPQATELTIGRIRSPSWAATRTAAPRETPWSPHERLDEQVADLGQAHQLAVEGGVEADAARDHQGGLAGLPEQAPDQADDGVFEGGLGGGGDVAVLEGVPVGDLGEAAQARVEAACGAVGRLGEGLLQVLHPVPDGGGLLVGGARGAQVRGDDADGEVLVGEGEGAAEGEVLGAAVGGEAHHLSGGVGAQSGVLAHRGVEVAERPAGGVGAQCLDLAVDPDREGGALVLSLAVEDEDRAAVAPGEVVGAGRVGEVVVDEGQPGVAGAREQRLGQQVFEGVTVAA